MIASKLIYTMAEIPNPFEATPKIASMEEKQRAMNATFKDKPFGTPHYLYIRGGEADEPTTAANVMQMSHYANPDLAMHSTYFGALDKMMQCVDRNVGETDPAVQEKVCASEFRALRVAALNRELMYSQVNRRWFMRELEWARNYSGF